MLAFPRGEEREGYEAFFLCVFAFDATAMCLPFLLADTLEWALVLREWWALRREWWCSRRFQPFLASERKDAGIAMVCDGTSVTAIAAASVRSARTSAMTLAG